MKKGKMVVITEEDAQLRREHRKRLKSRFVAQERDGRDDLEDNRMLELLLTYALPRKDVYPLANTLLAKFGSLDGVFSADIDSLTAVAGIKEHTALLLKLIPALNRRRAVSRSDRKCYRSEAEIIELMKRMFCEVREERMIAALFSAGGRLIVCDTVSDGTLSECTLDVQKLASMLGNSNVKYAVLAHNHPSGNNSPSVQDMQALTVTESLLAMTGTKLLDAYIISDDECVSLVKLKSAINKVKIDYDEDTVSYILGEDFDETDASIFKMP